MDFKPEDDVELLPCPHCGGEADVSEGSKGDGTSWWYVECFKCSATAESPDDWNKRTPYVSTPPTTPPTEGDEKRLRKMTKHEAIHELEGQCCVIARACCSLTNLDALTLAGFDIPETEAIMKLAGAVIERAKAIHDAEFISNSPDSKK